MLRIKKKPFFKRPLVWLVMAGAVYYLFFYKKTATSSPLLNISSNAAHSSADLPNLGSVSQVVTTIKSSDPIDITRVPPPGYGGPLGGPFTWAGIGSPPNGVYLTIGDPV